MASDDDLAALRRQQQRLTQWSGQMVIIDLLCMMVLPLERLDVPGTSFVANDVAIAGLTILAAFRAPRVRDRSMLWVVYLLATALGILAVSYLLNPPVIYIMGLDGHRRLAHLLLLFVLVISLGSGRIHPRSAITGISAGVLGATLLGLFKIGGDFYPGRLSGLFGDPNVAGMILSVLGPVIVGAARTKPYRLVYGAIVGYGIYATQSRTALLATSLALLWVLIGRRATRLQALVFPLIVVTLINNIPREWRTAGNFAGRTGSDWLRDQLLELETRAVDLAPWYGRGPNSAFTWFGDNFFFYHSSYLAARIEGGWPFLITIIAIYAGVFWSLVSLPRERRNLWMEGSAPAVFGISLYLGDVLLSMTCMVYLGLAIWHVRTARAAIAPPPQPLEVRIPTIYAVGLESSRRASR